MPVMALRRVSLLMMCITLLAFGLRIASLDAQSMWRDEIDTLCFSRDFWEVLQQAMGRGEGSGSTVAANIPAEGQAGPDRTPTSSSAKRLHCQPTPGMSRVDPERGFWPVLRTLLTLPGWNGPLYTVLMHPWISLTGESPFAVRYSSLLFGVLAVPLTYVLGRRLLGTTVGLVGALLIAMSPHLVWYSQEAKMYSAILALGLLAIYALRRALDWPFDVSGNRSLWIQGLLWWGGVVGATTLAVYTHILAALLIPLEAALALIWWPRTRRHWRGALLALAFLTLPYLPILAWQARSWLLPAGQATLFTLGRLDTILESTFNGWGGNYVGDPWATLILAGLALLALFGVARAELTDGKTEAADSDKRGFAFNWRDLLALLAWMLLPPLGIWLLSDRQPIFTNRYLIWAAPAFYLLAAAGFVALTRIGRSGALVAGGLLLMVLVGDTRALMHQANQPIKPDFQAAAAYLAERYQPGDLVVFHISYMENNFDYYFPEEYDGWGAPAAASGWSEKDIDVQMRTYTSGRGTVWLVLSEATMWDPQGLVKVWMDANAAGPSQEQAFAHVSVYRYILEQ